MEMIGEWKKTEKDATTKIYFLKMGEVKKF